jgi:ATP-dependent DNA ligase
VIKKINSPYEYGSRKNWWKVKPVLEATFEVIDVELGTGKYKDTVGALFVKDKSGLITSKVGSGLTDKDRDDFRNFNKECELKVCIDVKFNEITHDVDGNCSLRFPRFEKLRLDKSEADDLSSQIKGEKE